MKKLLIALLLVASTAHAQTFGIKGVTNGTPVSAGLVGQQVCVTTGSVGLANGVFTNVATLTSLPAGIWEIQGTINFASSAAATQFLSLVGVSTVSATLGAVGSYTEVNSAGNVGFNNVIPSPQVLLTTSSAGNVFLIGYNAFAAGSVNTTSLFCALRIS